MLFKECLANCIDQAYDVKITSASYPNHLAFIESSEFCIIYDKLLKACQMEKYFTLEERYPNICEILVENGTNCKQVSFVSFTSFSTVWFFMEYFG